MRLQRKPLSCLLIALSAEPFQRLLMLFMGLLVLVACDRSGTEDNSVPKHTVSISSTQTARAYEKGAWQLRRHAALNEIARRGDINLVFLGDSITQRWAEAGREVWDK